MTRTKEQTQNDLDIARERLDDARDRMQKAVASGCGVTSSTYQRLEKMVASLAADYQWLKAKL